MSTRLVQVVSAAGLLGLVWLAVSGSASSRIVTPFEGVLRAHGGRAALAAITAYEAQAVRLTSTQGAAFFERRLQVVVEGAKFMRLTFHPLGLREQRELFDGNAGFYTSLEEPGNAAAQVLAMDSRRLHAVRFSVETFGLLPLLRQYADPRSQAIFVTRAAGALDQFQVKTPAGVWNVFADQAHLICKVELGEQSIQFADYRPVNELRLPFVQRLAVGERLVYELVFTALDLNPTFSDGYFNPEKLGQATAR